MKQSNMEFNSKLERAKDKGNKRASPCFTKMKSVNDGDDIKFYDISNSNNRSPCLSLPFLF